MSVGIVAVDANSRSARPSVRPLVCVVYVYYHVIVIGDSEAVL